MLTWEQASRMSKDNLLTAIFKSAFKVDDLFAVMPFTRVNGKALVYSREGSQIAAAFIADGGAITESAQAVYPVTATLRTIAASAQLPGKVARNLNDNLDQVQVQMAALGRALARQLKTALVTGVYPSLTFTMAGVTLNTAGPYLKPGTASLEWDVSEHALRFRAAGDPSFGSWVSMGTSDVTKTITSGDNVQYITVDYVHGSHEVADALVNVAVASSTNAFDGLRAVVTNTLTGTTANGDAISFDLLRQLVDAVDPAAGQLVICAPTRTLRAVKALYDAKGGTTPMEMALQNYGLNKPYLTFDGVPILRNEYLPIDEKKGITATCTSLYCLALTEPTGAPSTAPFKAAGVCGLYGAGDQRETDEGVTMGVSVVVDPQPRDGDGKLMDAVEVAVLGDYALASYSEKSSARLYGITN